MIMIKTTGNEKLFVRFISLLCDITCVVVVVQRAHTK